MPVPFFANTARDRQVLESQYGVSDVIAMARSKGEACVQVFFIRSGKLIGREYFILEGTEAEENSEILEEFVKQFVQKGGQ